MTQPRTGHGDVTAHIINHTHWDREWFLTAEYTTQWIPALIDAIGVLADINPDYQYLFDGQTLAIEDLLASDPRYTDAVATLIGNGTLGIGPLYSQPDWRITSGESLLRNLSYGVSDLSVHGGKTSVAWLVDTFGHVSQAPQLLAQSGIDAVYIWRGAPQLEPLFTWQSPDGTEVTTVNLFGGYRNLYGITRTPDLAVRRLEAEVTKLEPHYRSLPIPLFDGYDLETEPEDPIRFYSTTTDIPDWLHLVESSPSDYISALTEHVPNAPTVRGELMSGKFGATFPGTLSTRTYLKVLQSDCEHLLHAVVEPFAVLANLATGRDYPNDRYEQWSRELLRNAVHDCICGVSIDQVHQRMERAYRQILTAGRADAEESLQSIAATLSAGTYVASTTPIPTAGTIRIDNQTVTYRTEGLGVWPATIEPVIKTETPTDDFAYPTAAGIATINADGTLTVGDSNLGRIVVTADTGDTYSSEPGNMLAVATPLAPVFVESTSATDAVVRADLSARWDGGSLDATLRFRLNESATVELSIDLDTTGTDFIAEIIFDTAIQGRTVAGMPYDLVDRNHADDDLLGHDLDDGLDRVLMGQREVDQVTSFPFQDHVAITNHQQSAIVHARGLRAYTSRPDGRVTLPLRRSVEWLAKSGLHNRAGDAGPAMYVPGARCERSVHHELGFTVLPSGARTPEFVAACQAFQHQPVPFVVDNSDGTRDEWQVLAGTLPMTSLAIHDHNVEARIHNPTTATVDINDAEVGRRSVQPNQILTYTPAIITPDTTMSDTMIAGTNPIHVHWPTFAHDRTGSNRSQPDPATLHRLRCRMDDLDTQARDLRDRLDEHTGDDHHRQLHKIYVDEREHLELALSLELNQRLLNDPDAEVSIPDSIDPIIAVLGERLNDLRIRRRIYDYVVEILAPAT